MEALMSPHGCLTMCLAEKSQKHGVHAAEAALTIMQNISVKEKEILELEHLLIHPKVNVMLIDMDLQTSRQLLDSMKRTLTAKLRFGY
jgi:predicted Ser/Thr protein kinase